MSRRDFLKKLKLLRKEVKVKKVEQEEQVLNLDYVRVKKMQTHGTLPTYTIPDCHMLVFKKQNKIVECYWGINKETNKIEVINTQVVERD